MAKSGHSNEAENYKIVAQEINRFKKLIKGYEKLLIAIGKL